MHYLDDYLTSGENVFRKVVTLIRILGNYILKSLFYVKKFTDLKNSTLNYQK